MADGGTAIALLAAGMSRRFGGGKLDQDLGGKPLGCWSADVAQAAGFARRIIITAPTPPSFVGQLVGWDRIVNREFETGMASSIRAASIAAAGHGRLVIMLADMPLIEGDHLYRLAQSDRVAFTLYPDGKKGVPAGFPEDAFGVLASMPDGLSPAKLNWACDVDVIGPRSAASVFDIDTKGDLAAARSMIGTKGQNTRSHVLEECPLSSDWR